MNMSTSTVSDGYKLTREIICLSVSDNWSDAKHEWSLAEVFISEEPGTCLCGHYPILEICVLHNRKNGKKAIVGNVCVKRFLGIASDKLFLGINRIAKDRSRSLNSETIDYAYKRGFINDWEMQFYLDTKRKRKLSPRQRAKREQINENVLAGFGVEE